MKRFTLSGLGRLISNTARVCRDAVISAVLVAPLFLTASASALTPPVIQEHPLAASSSNVAAGANGTVWITDANNTLEELNTAGAVIASYPNMGAQYDMILGPDGNLWELERTSVNIVSTSGVVLGHYN